MKNKLHMYISILVIIIILISLIISFFFLPSKLDEKKKNMYVEYINSILPNPYSEDIKTLTGRENIAKISHAIKTYYNACNKENTELVKDILNIEYINYMNINVNDLIEYNNVARINANTFKIDTIYKANNNIFWAVINKSDNVYYIGILLSEDSKKYSIILDGIYNNDDIKKYEMDYQVEGIETKKSQ